MYYNLFVLDVVVYVYMQVKQLKELLLRILWMDKMHMPSQCMVVGAMVGQHRLCRGCMTEIETKKPKNTKE